MKPSLIWHSPFVCDNIDPNKFPDIGMYREISANFGGRSTFFSDRTQSITLPFDVKSKKENEMLTFDSYDIDFSDAARITVDRFTSQQKHMYLMWSGGIDSTVMVLAFFLNHSYKDRITIVCNKDSIRENWNFYKNFIRPYYKIVSTEQFNNDIRHSIVDGIIVQAEHADLLFSVSVGRFIKNELGEDFLYKKFNRDNFISFYSTRPGMSKRYASCMFDLVNQTTEKSPIEIETIEEFAWWANFNFRWAHAKEKFRARIDPKNDYQTFFSSPEMQKWSIFNLKTNSRQLDEKTGFRNYLSQHIKDQEYCRFKKKWASNSKHFATWSAHTITENGELLDNKFDIMPYYNENNFFSEWLKKN
jgi:hypothetical protein